VIARRVAFAAAVALLAAAAFVPALADRGFYGRTGVFAGEPTTAGEWAGTWIYVSRDARMALWLRAGKDGAPEARLQYQSTAGPETFETDWSGKANYYLSGQAATFEIRLARRERDEIEGRWEWLVDFGDSGRSETSDFRIYRVVDGRSLALEFKKGYVKEVRRGARITRQEIPPVLSFVKASRRLVLWDELPW
jgi:hypothetical protein